MHNARTTQAKLIAATASILPLLPPKFLGKSYTVPTKA
jgi:hypothetical protein